jgi:hypothetical protein
VPAALTELDRGAQPGEPPADDEYVNVPHAVTVRAN